MDKLADAITDYYIRKKVIAEDKKEIYSYGFKLIIADIINYAIIITLGVILDRLTESIVFLISLCGLRQFCGGFHAKTFWLCRLSMIITYLCVILLTDMVTYTDYKTAIVLSVNILSIIFISIFAPAEHPNKPLSDVQKRGNRIKSIIISISLSTASFIFMIVGMKKLGITISITLLAVIILMIIGLLARKGG